MMSSAKMPGRTLVSVGWCASHWKGGDPGGSTTSRHPGEEHCLWLDHAVAWYERRGWPVIVSATDYPGILDIETRDGNRERDVLWQILARGVPIISTVHNPGHQVGAALCIRLGLEYAARCGYDFLIHTAEDILPRPGVCGKMTLALEDGADYAGEKWGTYQNELNAQFFACRAQALVGPWDACQVGGYGHIERYLAAMVGERPQYYIPGAYRTTHNFEEWLQWEKEQSMDET